MRNSVTTSGALEPEAETTIEGPSIAAVKVTESPENAELGGNKGITPLGFTSRNRMAKLLKSNWPERRTPVSCSCERA